MTADRIRALREARGWTQAELARRLSITRNGVNSWEQGLSMPSPTCLVDWRSCFPSRQITCWVWNGWKWLMSQGWMRKTWQCWHSWQSDCEKNAKQGGFNCNDVRKIT